MGAGRDRGSQTDPAPPFPPSKRYEQQMQELEKKSEQQREVLARLQQEYQRTQGKAVSKA